MAQIEREQSLPVGMRLRIFNQRTSLIHVTTHNVLHNLVLGMGLVFVILLVFLGTLAGAAIVALMIPLALLFSVALPCSRWQDLKGRCSDRWPGRMPSRSAARCSWH
jgi:cobalt-zinc-cadmium resistance protein CzcA